MSNNRIFILIIYFLDYIIYFQQCSYVRISPSTSYHLIS